MPDLTDKAELLALWLDGELSAEQRQAFEQLCLQDEDFAEQVASANTAIFHAENYTSEPVPEWDKGQTFETAEKPKWWQWQGLPAMSFATSMLAIVMVVTGFTVKVDDGALTISFADQHKQQRALEDKLARFEQNQQNVLMAYVDNLQRQQAESNTQLTNYLLSSSREERREDFAELIKFINQQRSDDQLFFARQMNNLQQELYQNAGFNLSGGASGPGGQVDGVE